METLVVPPVAAVERPRGVKHGVGFWFVAGAFLTAMAFSTVPTPLYALYQRRDGFSAFLVTVVFAVYAVGVVTSLVLAGHLSDTVGRKRVLIPALALEVLAAVVFLIWPAVPGLLLARLITGLGVGLTTATATAYLQDLHTRSRPGTGHGRFEVVSTAANIGGLGVGPLVAGFLAQFVSAPLRTPYVVFTVLLLLSIVAVGVTGETVEVRAERPAWRPQRISASHGDRVGYLAAATSAFGAFAIFGLFTSLAPTFVAGSLHHPGRLIAGVTVFVVFGVAALAQTLTTRLSLPIRLGAGLGAEALGLLLLVASMDLASMPGFLLGGALAGAGAGMVFKAAIGTVASVAAPEVRGEALAGLFLIAYLGLIGPVLGLGIATRFTSALTAMHWFAAALVLLVAAGGLLARAARRR